MTVVRAAVVPRARSAADRLGNCAPGDAEHDAVGHEGRIEREQRSSWQGTSRLVARSSQRIGRGEGVRQRSGLDARRQGSKSDRPARHVAVDDDDAQRVDARQRARRPAMARLGGSIGAAAKRRGLAQQGAQVGVLPGLDAPVRQARLREGAERFARAARVAGKLRLDGGE